MTRYHALAEIVPPECAADMRRTLGVTHIPGENATVQLRGVECRFKTYGIETDSRLVVLCAQPVNGMGWDFGTCFPQLPGAWSQGNSSGAFHLRFLSLEDSIWFYVWTRDPSLAPVEAALKDMKLFSDWAAENSVDLGKHGLERDDLEQIPDPPPRVTVAKSNFSLTKPSWSGFFMWGSLADSLLVPSPLASDTDVNPASAAALLSQIHDFVESTAGHLIFRARLRYDPPEETGAANSPNFRRLLLETPPLTTNLGGSGLQIGDASIFLTAPNFFSKDNTRVGLKADLLLPQDRRIHFELDFPITGDIIHASGSYLGDPEHLLGSSADFGLPGPPAQFGADTRIAVGLEFSKSQKTLTKLTFALDLRNKDWTLIPAPVDLELEGVSVDVTVLDPLKPDSRQVRARMAVAASFAAGEDRVHLTGGGRYPEGDIYLQSGDSLKVGKLIEKLVGPSPELEKFTIDDLRLDYNYRSRQMALSFDVPDRWQIVEGFEIGALQFRVQGRGHYGGGLSARIDLDVGATTPLQIMLSGIYDGGWQFEGTTGPGQKIPLGKLFGALADSFGPNVSAPASLDEALNVSDVGVYFDTATRAFDFRCRLEMEIQDRKVDLDLSIAIDHHQDPKNNGKTLAKTRFSGVIHLAVPPKSYQFQVIFDREEIVLANEDEVLISTLLASFNSTEGDPPKMKDMVPKDYKEFVPDISTAGAFIARQWRKNADGSKASKWLIGLSLEAGLDLSNVKLPSLPLVGSGGPPKSLKLDLQLLVPMPSGSGFDKDEIAILGKLNSSGAVSIPDHEVAGIAVATVLNLDGKTIKLNLPIVANPNPGKDEAKFVRDTAPPPPAVPVANVVADADATKWITIQRSFGPVHLERIGLKYADERLSITLDGGLTAAGFTISLHGLGIDTPLTEFDPHFHITGIGLDYANGGIEIGAAFLKQDMIDPEDPKKTYTAYAGQAVLKTPTLSLSALGSFAKYHGEPSLFIYAMLDYPLGGPAFFFVTGLAAGFGYNRRAIIPPVSQLHAYPLITKAIAGPVERDDKGTVIKPDLATELGRMEAYLPPDTGSLFFTVGVKFSSFELIDSFALLIAGFGHETQFDVLGVSVLKIPSRESGGGGTPLAEIHMNWHGYLHPAEGAIGLSAEIAPGSYVFSRDCHLTGGFAYASWFNGEDAGDFVYTLGGYHPDYKKPDHYPTVPRLGFNWVLPAANLALKGELYYALTAHAFMAGGMLDASIHGGFDIGIAGIDFHAHMHIAADFLITWEPYHYDAKVSLDLDIGVTAHLLFFSKSFSLNIGGDMHVWGPDFAGEAHLHLKVWKISHTIDVTFGAGPPRLVPITWDRFADAFLPKITQDVDAEADAAGTAKVQIPDQTKICGVSIQSGLISQSGDRWVINPSELCLITDSIIPISASMLGTRPVADNGSFADIGPDGGPRTRASFSHDFGVAPMGLHHRQLRCVHTITILRDEVQDADEFFRSEPVLKQLPSAMWGAPVFTDASESYLAKPRLNPSHSFQTDLLCGIKILPAVLLHPSRTSPIDRRELLYDTDGVADAYRWQEIPTFTPDPKVDALDVLDSTIHVKAPVAGQPAPACDIRAEIARELGFAQTHIAFPNPVHQHLQAMPQIDKV